MVTIEDLADHQAPNLRDLHRPDSTVWLRNVDHFKGRLGPSAGLGCWHNVSRQTSDDDDDDDDVKVKKKNRKNVQIIKDGERSYREQQKIMRLIWQKMRRHLLLTSIIPSALHYR